MADSILYSDIKADSFLTALKMHGKQPSKGYLPDESLLKDFKISGIYETRADTYTVDIYFINEYDLLSDESTHFLVFRSNSNISGELEKIAYLESYRDLWGNLKARTTKVFSE